jgi:glycosyltransferase involved in cell wall biosynthesis
MRTIDILVPVYNRAEHLPELLRSCLRQSHKASRIIMVDDASTEPKVAELLSHHADRFDEIRVVSHEENRGVCAAQQTALEHSTADFVAFLDCDDFLPTNALERVHEHLSTGVDYLFSDRIEIEPNGSERLVRYGGQPHLIGDGSVGDHLLDNMVASHLKVLDRRRLMDVGGFTDSVDGIQDWDIALRISEIGTLEYIPEPLYFHRVHPGQLSQIQNQRMIRDTNSVRRRTLCRRFGPRFERDSMSILGVEPADRISLLHLAESAARFDAAVGVDSERRPVFIPLGVDDQRKNLEGFDLDYVLIHHHVEYRSTELLNLWRSPRRPTLCFLTSDDMDDNSTSRFRWLNSYFDEVFMFGRTNWLALDGLAHNGLKLIDCAEKAGSCSIQIF